MVPRPVLFDTDIGSDVDDALALGLILAARDRIDLVGVTTVASDPALAARIASGLLGMAGRRDVEVAAGEAAPILRRHGFNAFGHEKDCLLDGPGAPVVSEPAPERIVRAAREIAGLEIVLVGPLTNLARALALDPELPRRVAGITVMGGHIREALIGDFVAPFGIDYNLCIDPEASVAVLGAGFSTTLVTADVTLQTWLTGASLERMRGGGELARTLAHQVDLWSPVQRQIFTAMGGRVDDDNKAFLHDPLTVFSLLDESVLTFESLRIVPTLEAGVFRTLEAPADQATGATLRVAMQVDAPRASAAIGEVLGNL
ncbi:nucleoside hydrolase [Myxococcota bacterium]|nr:nucleoside hydrolase [Myxococcota bacterium]